jgi:hypothetical protein
MTDFKFMNSPLGNEADFALSNLDRLLTRAKADIKTTIGAVKDIATKKAWTDPKKNASYTDLGKGASEAKQRANKALKDKNEANKAAEREKTAKDNTLKYVEPRKPRATAGASDPTKEVADRYRKEGRENYEKNGARDLSRSEADGTLGLDKRFKTGEKRYEPKKSK